MKVVSIFKLFLTSIYLIISSICLAGGEETVSEKTSKKIKFEAKTERNVEVRLTNKYGKVNVISWDRDSVKMVVEITAVAKTKDEAEKIVQRVYIEPVYDEKYFIATTEITEKSSGNVISQLIDNLVEKGKEAIDKTNVEINITISMPERGKLILNNKYGDIGFEKSFKGNLQLTLAYGNLSVSDLPPFANLNLQSGKAYIGSLQNGRIALKYGELNLKNADRLYLESHSSEINIDEIKDLDLDSRNDDFDIIVAQSITGKTSLSKVFVQEMKQKARLEMQGGSFKIRTLKNSFEWIDIQSKSTDIKITPEENLAYQLDVSGTPTEVISNQGSTKQGGSDSKSNGNLPSIVQGLTGNNKSNPLNMSINFGNSNHHSGSKKVIKINATGGQILVK
jgi:hypothetical protein